MNDEKRKLLLHVAAPESRMTLRISRDSGRTWSPTREIRTGQGSAREWLSPVRFPPCDCPLCTANPRRR